MTRAERDLVVAMLRRAAAAWARGDVPLAERWARTAYASAGTDAFVDDDEVTR